MPHFPNETEYSDKYSDDYYEFRHVLLPKHIYKMMPRGRLLSEDEWRQLGYAFWLSPFFSNNGIFQIVRAISLWTQGLAANL